MPAINKSMAGNRLRWTFLLISFTFGHRRAVQIIAVVMDVTWRKWDNCHGQQHSNRTRRCYAWISMKSSPSSSQSQSNRFWFVAWRRRSDEDTGRADVWIFYVREEDEDGEWASSVCEMKRVDEQTETVLFSQSARGDEHAKSFDLKFVRKWNLCAGVFRWMNHAMTKIKYLIDLIQRNHRTKRNEKEKKNERNVLVFQMQTI